MTEAPTITRRWGGRRPTGLVQLDLIGLGLLAVLAYVPALRSSPGRMPADSKLYLYLDPGRFLGDAASSFDPRQYAGWVPHQHIAYLWPAGPYYWLADLVGLPDWVAHRIWIGSLLFAAGTGMWWCARRFGFRGAPLIAGAVVYQWAIYILPYVSRTSVMLLPWAGLGWILGLTVQATWQRSQPLLDRRARWRYPALIALVVFTVGSVNATALLMITPAPALWLLYWAAGSRTRWPAAIGIALRTGATCVAVSLWWIAMLVIQGRYGAEVLPFSETLQDVSFTSTAPEVWRGLGYWLFYIRDIAGPTTTASAIYLVSGAAIVISFAIPLFGLVGLAFTDWTERRFAWLLVGVGGVLAVGVYPFEHMAPLMAILTGNGQSGFALSLRSSTRAVPVMMVGLALGVAALCSAVPARLRGFALARRLPRSLDGLRRLPTRPIACALVIVFVLANAPSLRHAELVDPMLERAEDPPSAWLDAAATLSGEGTSNGRVLQVPGIEFGDYRWGFTVDQPLPGLIDKPLVTRDLLPLGSAAAMDVLYAIDDRIQDGTATSAQIEAAARLLGVDTIWLTGDLAFDRFNTARPVDIQDAVETLGASTTFGEPRINTPTIDWQDERSLAHPQTPIAPVELINLGRPSQVTRAAAGTIAVSGSGDGLVTSAPVTEASARGAIVYTADRRGDKLEGVQALVITDSNRNRDRHWRTSHDSVGATLTASDPVSDLERAQRLPVFADQATDNQTVSVQDGPVTAYAARYGEPFGFQPEHRAAMAIDGDPVTAWTVGEHGDPVGASIVIDPQAPVDRLELYQFLPIPGQRRISSVRISWPVDLTVTLPDPPYGVPGAEFTVELDDGEPGEPSSIELPKKTAMPITIEILAVDGGTPLTEGIVADVGFTEIVASGDDGPLPPTTEWIRTPIDAVESVPPGFPVAYSLERERIDPLNPWRSDPEPELRRIITVGQTATFLPDAQVRLDPDIDDRELATLFGVDTWASSRLGGSLAHWGRAAHDGDPGTAWMSAFNAGLGATIHLGSAAEPVDSLTIRQPDPSLSQINGVEIRSGGVTESAVVASDDTGLATIDLAQPLPPGELTITVTEMSPATTIDRRFGDLRELPVSISEIEINDETAATDDTSAQAARVNGASSNTDGCADLVRIDDTVLRAKLAVPTDLDDRLVDVTWCDDASSAGIDLDVGEHRISDVSPNWVQVDAVDLRNEAFGEFTAAPAASVTAEVVTGSRFDRQIRLSGCDEGCWLVFGEGFNPGWSAAIGGEPLGPPVLVDGVANGWWIPPERAPQGTATVDVHWSQQSRLTWAIVLSGLAVLACLALSFGRTPAPSPTPLVGWRWSEPRRLDRRGAVLLAIGIIAAVVAFVGLAGAWIGLIVAVAVLITRRVDPVFIAPPLLVAITAFVVVRAETAERFTADALWPRQFASVHPIAMSAFALALVAGLASSKPNREGRDDGG